MGLFGLFCVQEGRGWRISVPKRLAGSGTGREQAVQGDVVHLLKSWPATYSLQNENGPRGGAVPKGPLLLPNLSGIPAPRFSCRETPFNRATRYLGATRCVKAILALLTAGPGVGGIQAETSGPGWRRGQVDLFDNVPRYAWRPLYHISRRVSKRTSNISQLSQTRPPLQLRIFG